MAEAARMVEAAGADLVDLNFGCPVRKVTKTGAGATLLDDPDHAARIVSAIAAAVDIPVSVKLRRGLRNGSRDCLVVGPRLVGAGAASLTLHPRSAQQMYTGTADHALTAELVSLVDVPVVASGDIVSRAKAQAVLATTGAAAVMVGRAAQGNPWVLEEIVDGAGREPSREEIVAELVLFVRETVRELGERRASGFLKKFYGWYLGRGRFPRPFKQELVVLDSTEEVERRLARRGSRCDSAGRAARGRDPLRRRGHARASDLGLRRRLRRGGPRFPRDSFRHRAATRRLAPAGKAGLRPQRSRVPRVGPTRSVRAAGGGRQRAEADEDRPRDVALHAQEGPALAQHGPRRPGHEGPHEVSSRGRSRRRSRRAPRAGRAWTRGGRRTAAGRRGRRGRSSG